MSSADRRGLARIHTRQGNFRGALSHSARQGATPDAYDARTARIYPVRRCSSLSARAERADRVEAESRLSRRLHLDAIDATDESGGCPHRGRKDKKRKHNTPNLEHPPRARRRPFQMLERLGGRRPRRSI